jgi:NAD(P)-dependent dehydrogenase (short-subunit alcohol dehydrogenase family)
MLLKDKLALITGGAQGIGLAIARAFAEQGASLVIADLKADEAALRRALPDGTQLTLRLVDVTDEASVVELFNGIPVLDILVNSVGTYGPVKQIATMDRAEWDRTFAVNLTSAMLCSREAVKKMRGQKSGNIVNIASNVARRGLPYRGCYVATKWAMMGLTQTLALETAADNIRVNSILPGPVETPHLEEVMELHAKIENKQVSDVAEEWRNCAPMKRFIEPEEIGSVAVFLASSMSSAMTGQGLNVTGGFVMT